MQGNSPKSQVDAVYPHAAEIIFTEFKKQSEHRRELEKRVVPEKLKNARTGIYVQALYVVVSGASTILTALFTPPWVPVTLAAMYCASTVAIYMYGKKKQSDEIRSKQ